MKIIKILMCLILFAASLHPVSAKGEEIFKTLDFNKPDKKEDRELFYSFFLKTCNATKTDVRKKHWEKLKSRAQSIDLNGDGVNELIGFSDHYCSEDIESVNFYIFKKTKKGYKLIYTEEIDNNKPVYIMNSKTNGYRDILFHGSSAHNFKSFIARYNNGRYSNEEEIQVFLDALKQ